MGTYNAEDDDILIYPAFYCNLVTYYNVKSSNQHKLTFQKMTLKIFDKGTIHQRDVHFFKLNYSAPLMNISINSIDV